MNYIEKQTFTKNEIEQLYNSVGWKNYTDNIKKLMSGIKHSMYCLAVYDEDTLIGLIRCIGDTHTIVYVQDLLVDPAYQGRGIGRKLLTTVLNKYSDVYQFVLITDEQKSTEAFYSSCGLKNGSKFNIVPFIKV